MFAKSTPAFWLGLTVFNDEVIFIGDRLGVKVTSLGVIVLESFGQFSMARLVDVRNHWDSEISLLRRLRGRLCLLVGIVFRVNIFCFECCLDFSWIMSNFPAAFFDDIHKGLERLQELCVENFLSLIK
jgi:hypothetical protein